MNGAASARDRGRSIVRIGGIAIGASLLAAGTTAVSLAGILRYERPAQALAFVPFDAVANATLADRMLQTGEGAPDQITAFASRAIARSPLSPSAMRTLGYLADANGDVRAARRCLAVADQLTRRDLPTNLWLIEDAVKRDDVAGALDHYDAALRTSRMAESILFPVLASVAADPEFTPSLTKVLSRNPQWIIEFIPYALRGGGATEQLATLVESLPTGSDARDRQLTISTLGKLVDEHRYERAVRFLDSGVARAAGSNGRRSAHVIGAFDEPRGFVPYAWSLTQSPEIETAVDGGSLVVLTKLEGQGIAASRLFDFEPGQYRLSVTNASAEAAKASWEVACAGPGGRLLATLPLPVARGAASTPVRIDAGCRAVTLQLKVEHDDAGQRSEVRSGLPRLVRSGS